MTMQRRLALVSLPILVGAAIGLVWWWFFADTNHHSTVSAQAIVNDACSQTEAQQSFDLITLVTGPFAGPGETDAPIQTWVYEASVSGDDFHLVISTGEVRDEFLGVDGVNYRKENGSWVRQDEIDLEYVHFLLNSRTYGPNAIEGDVLCADEPVTNTGQEMIGVIPVNHFQLTDTETVGPVGNVGDAPDGMVYHQTTIDKTLDFWVDMDGLIVQTKQLFAVSTGEEFEMLTSVVGVGEPNVLPVP